MKVKLFQDGDRVIISFYPLDSTGREVGVEYTGVFNTKELHRILKPYLKSQRTKLNITVGD